MAYLLVLHASGEAELPPGFENSDGDGIGKIQAALTGEHRQAQAALIGKFGHDLRRQTAGLPPENEYIVRMEGRRVVAATAFCCDGKQTAIGQDCFAAAPVCMPKDPGEFVIVEPGAAQGAVLPAKTEGFNEVQFGTGICTKSDYVARVGRDLGLKQNNSCQSGLQKSALVLFIIG